MAKYKNSVALRIKTHLPRGLKSSLHKSCSTRNSSVMAFRIASELMLSDEVVLSERDNCRRSLGLIIAAISSK